MPVFLTVIQVEVLCEEQTADDMSLSDIAEAIDSGDSSGAVTVLSSRALSNAEARVATLAQGSDPSFFSVLRDEDEEEGADAGATLEGPFDLPVYFPVSTTYDGSEGPLFAKLVLNQAFLENLGRLESVCSLHELAEARISGGPDNWGSGTEELRLQMPELVVSSGNFWFRDHPKDTKYEIETGPHPIEALRAVFAERAFANNASPLFLGASPADLQQSVDETEASGGEPLSDVQR